MQVLEVLRSAFLMHLSHSSSKKSKHEKLSHMCDQHKAACATSMLETGS